MTNKPPRPDDPIARVDDALTQLENQRTAGLIDAQRYQEINQRALEKEQIRLSRKYGEGHPEAQKIAARLTYNRNLFAGLNQEISRSESRMPPLPQNGWRVRGQVFDGANAPMGKQNVYLSDERREPITEIAYACTDQRGYYAITLSDKEVEAVKGRALYLTASDANRTVLYRSPEPLRASPGKIELRNIYIGQKECTPPFDKDTPAPDEEYVVQGIITERSGKSVPNRVVRAFDQDLKKRHPLGEKAITNADGFYRIPYRASDFNPKGTEITGADVIICVYDDQDRELQKSEVMPNADRTTTINVTITNVVG